MNSYVGALKNLRLKRVYLCNTFCLHIMDVLVEKCLEETHVVAKLNDHLVESDVTLLNL